MLKKAIESIEGFTLDEGMFIPLEHSEDAVVSGVGAIFVRGEVSAKIKINFRETENCKVFIGHNVRGNITVKFHGDNSLLFIGNNCRLNQLQIKSFQNNDFIAVGNGVTTTAKNVWISGNGSGSAQPAIIIGDDCMFAYDVVIRNSDAHPIYNYNTDEQVNKPKDIVHIEPHVWIGEQVSILKSVTVGACSIIGLGSVVTKSAPRFSILNGVPAKAQIKKDIYWSRSDSDQARARAKYFVYRYSNL